MCVFKLSLEHTNYADIRFGERPRQHMCKPEGLVISTHICNLYLRSLAVHHQRANSAVRTGFEPVIDTISCGRSISVSPVGIVTLHFRGVFLSPPDYIRRYCLLKGIFQLLLTGSECCYIKERLVVDRDEVNRSLSRIGIVILICVIGHLCEFRLTGC